MMFTEAAAKHYRQQYGIQITSVAHRKQHSNAQTPLGRQTGPDNDDTASPIVEKADNELVEFLSNFSLHGYRWLAPSNEQNGWVVTIWLVVHVLAAAFIGFILHSVFVSFSVHPLVTTLADTLYPIGRVPFPAISICNNNRISKRQAQKYADELNRFDANDTLGMDADRMAGIRNMGRLVDSDWETSQELMDFQTYLNTYDANDTYYDTNAHMRSLVPQCDDMMLHCSWRGVEQPCIQRGIMFEQRRTQYGHCCTFNYVRTDSLTNYTAEHESSYIDDVGPDLGLILMLNGTSRDYFYPLYNMVGFIVQVFNPNEFPDVPSGSVSERLVELGYETFIRIDSSTLITERESKLYSAETRDCLFEDELAEKFGGQYKRSDCVVNCRVASIVALCNCLMYLLPGMQITSAEEQAQRRTLPQCTLEHVPCLNRYRIKWSTMLLTVDKIVGLEFEREDGLYCPECLPSCSETTYIVSYQDLPLVKSFTRRDPDWFANVTDVSDVALVRIFLGKQDTLLYRQKVALSWYEIISNIGGMCGVVSGFSLVSLAEVMYFVAMLIWVRLRPAIDGRQPTAIAPNNDVAPACLILP